MAETRDIPLRIHWLDATGEMEEGSELRFEVHQEDESGDRKIAIHRLGFDWSPIVWGEVRPDPEDPFLGICRVVALAETDDIYEVPEYEVSAYVKAAGGSAVRPDRRLAVDLGPVEYPLRFFVEQGSQRSEFDPLEQKRPIGLDAFTVRPPGAATVFLRDDRFYVRIDEPELDPVATVEFPNGEMAELALPGREPVAEEPAASGTGPEATSSPDEETGAEPEPEPPADGPPRWREPTQVPPAPEPVGTPRDAPTPPEGTPVEPVEAVETVESVEPQAPPPPPESPRTSGEETPPVEDGFEQVRDLIRELSRYASSFPVDVMPPQAMKAVRDRIQDQVDRVREAMEGYAGRHREEIEELWERVVEELPDAVQLETEAPATAE